MFVFASGSEIYIYNLETDTQIQKLEGHTSLISAMTLFKNKKKLASGSIDRTIRCWDLSIYREQDPSELNSGVSVLTVWNDKKKVVSIDDHTAICIWDLETGKRLQKVEGNDRLVNRHVIFNNGKKLIFGDNLNKIIYIYNLETWEEFRRFELYDNICTLTVSNNEKKAILVGRLGAIYVLDLDKGIILKKFEEHTSTIKRLTANDQCTVRSLICFNDAKRLIIGNIDGSIYILDLETGGQIKRLNGHKKHVTILAIFSNEKKIASGSVDKIISIWSLETGEELRRLIGHENGVSALAIFSKDKGLISGSWDGTIRIWDIEKNEQILILNHPFSLRTIILSNDKTIYAGDSKGGLWLWKLHPKAESFEPELLWATHPTLSCYNASVHDARGLSDANLRLMHQHGAVIKSS